MVRGGRRTQGVWRLVAPWLIALVVLDVLGRSDCHRSLGCTGPSTLGMAPAALQPCLWLPSGGPFTLVRDLNAPAVSFPKQALDSSCLYDI